VNKPNKNKLKMEICRKNKSAQNEEFLLWLGNQQQTASAEAVMRIKWIYNEKKVT
jgi:hypothetical protein